MESGIKTSGAGGTVPILRKANRVFELVARSPGGATAKSIAVSLQIAPATCYRILRSYVADGWLRQGAGGAFELSFGLIPMLRPLLRHEVLIETVREPMAQLARATGITVKLSIRQGDEHLGIYSAQSPRAHSLVSRVGALGSLAVGSSGAVFLGELSDAEVIRVLDNAPREAWKFQKRETVLRRVRDGRKLGYYFDAGSYQPNINSMSAALYGVNREVVAVLTLLGFPQDFVGAERNAAVRELKYAAGGCSQLIQGSAAVAHE